MTSGAFKNLVWSMAKTDGVPYLKPTDVADFNDLCQAGLMIYSANTQCLQSDQVAFRPVVSKSSYDTWSPPASQGATTIPAWLDAAFCSVRQVTINGGLLRMLGDDEDRPGESSEALVNVNYPSYQTAVNGPPVVWWQELPNKLRFNCPFDQVYSNCFITGRLYHSPLLSDAQLLDIAVEDEFGAARRCASMLLEPNSPEKAAEKLKECLALEKVRLGECTVKLSGLGPRGSGDAIQRISLTNSGGSSANPRWRW